MPILNKNKYEVDQKKFSSVSSSKTEAVKEQKTAGFFSNKTNVITIALIGIFLILLIISGIATKMRNAQPQETQPEVVKKTTATAEDPAYVLNTDTTETSATASAETSETANTEETTALTEQTVEPGPSAAETTVDQVAVNAQIISDATALGLFNSNGDPIVYPIPHTTYTRIPVDTEMVSALPYGIITQIIDADTFKIRILRGDDVNFFADTDVIINLAGISCVPFDDGANTMVINWEMESVTNAEAPYTEPGGTQIFIELAAEAPTMSDGTYNAYLYYMPPCDDDPELTMLNERMLVEGWAQPNHGTVNMKYYDYFKQYPYTYQNIG